MVNPKFVTFDRVIIQGMRKMALPAARIALFIVFFWFGALKLTGVSPANPLIEALLTQTLPFLTFHQFILGLGVYEMIIGLAFLIPRFERLAIIMLIPHMITTFMPLILLPAITWQGFLTPTLEGQYIIKNLLIIALALSFATHLNPLYQKSDIRYE